LQESLITLKKLTTYIVLILFTYNLAGYYVVFKGWQNTIRFQIRNQIRQESRLLKPEVLTFSKTDLIENKIDLEWEKDDEFCYNNSMYDVVSRTESTDSITFTCINDRREMKLIRQFQAYADQQHNHSRSNPFKILENLVKDYCSNQQIAEYYRDGIPLNKPRIKVSLHHTFSDVISPPPKRFI
jgi:hypothetical protein